jgi:hypothetical protein
MAQMAWFPARFAGRDGGRAQARLLVLRIDTLNRKALANQR